LTIRTIVIDGNNVMGAAADGWWRDRPAAVRRLLGRIQCYARSVDEDVVLVLDQLQADIAEGENDGGTVRSAPRRGPNAADDRIRELMEKVDASTTVVATSDRALAADIRAAGAEVIGARTFLDKIEAAGC